MASSLLTRADLISSMVRNTRTRNTPPARESVRYLSEFSDLMAFRDQNPGDQPIEIAATGEVRATFSIALLGVSDSERIGIRHALQHTHARPLRYQLLSNDDPDRAQLLIVAADDVLAMRRLRAIQQRRALPTVLLGGRAGTTDQPVLARPLSPPQLIKCLDTIATGIAERMRAARAAGGMRVLLVTSSEVERETLQGLLQRQGVTADVAASGEAALVRMVDIDYHLVLLDHRLPGMTGCDLCKAIKARRDRHAPHVLLLDPRASTLDRLRARLAGCDGWLPLPLEPERVLSVLRDLGFTPPAKPRGTGVRRPLAPH